MATLIFIYIALCLCHVIRLFIKMHQGLKISFLQFVVNTILSPLILVVLIYKSYKRYYYKDKPMPVPKKLRRYVKKDTVMHDHTTMSLAEYNYKFNKKFTLEDVYGKKYVRSLSLDEIANFDKCEDSISYEDNLPDDMMYRVCKAFAQARNTDDFSDFENYLSDDVVFILYNKERIVGRNNFISYWKDYKRRNITDKVILNTTLKICNYYKRVAILDRPKGYSRMYLLFSLQNDKIVRAVYAPNPLHANSLIRYCDLDQFPFGWSVLDKSIQEGTKIPSKHNQVPCLNCGKLSEDLLWFHVKIRKVDLEYIGDLSICPNCVEQVEFKPDIMVRYGMDTVKKMDREEKDSCKDLANVLNETREKLSIYYRSVTQKHYDEVLSSLASELKVDEELDERNLYFCNSFEDMDIKGSEVIKSTFINKDDANALWKQAVPIYLALAEKGNAEAYNYLGGIFQTDEMLSVKYFKLGIEFGSLYAAYNLACVTSNMTDKFSYYLWVANHSESLQEEDDIPMLCIVYLNIAIMYHLGIGVMLDKKEAEKWYRKARIIGTDPVIKDRDRSYLAQTLTRATNNLGVLLYEKQQTLESIKMFREFRFHNMSNSNYIRSIFKGASNAQIMLSLIGACYMDNVYKKANKCTKEVVFNSLLLTLPDLKWSEDFILDDFRPQKIGIDTENSVLWLYARPHDQKLGDITIIHRMREKQLPPSIFQYITLPFTPEAIWEAYLLKQTYRLIGMRGDEKCEARIFLNVYDDIDKMGSAENQIGVKNIWSPKLLPSVQLFEDAAIVTHCWFDENQGLLQVNCRILYDKINMRIVNFKMLNEKMLYSI
ncbi:sel1 repeat family protein [Phocaeicola coprophilus]|nr:sel1 repeat family protein [Phocaeicola coprophilus]